MATATGTATNYANLLDLLNTFLTVTISPAWTSLRAVAGTEMIWQAPGGGSDTIIVGAKIFSNVGGDYYNWRLGGFFGFDSSLPFEQQAGYVGGVGGVNPSPVLNLWNGSIPYWFFANSRRAIVVAKVSTVYVTAYLGFLASYMSPGAYPYPMIVGGSMATSPEPAAISPNWRWSYAGAEMSNFPIPQAVVGDERGSSLRLRLGSGIWRGFNLTESTALGRVMPYAKIAVPDWRANLDGGYTLFPIILADPTPNVYGELDGIFAVTGFGNGAENTITIGADTYLVVPNVFRTDQKSYFAIKEA